MRDSTQIENLAVSHIVTVFSTSKRICPWLHMGDKEPLWDGALYLYRTEDHNTGTLCGRVPCQIKGVDLSNEPEKESFYLTKEELANYLRDGGVLFFLVHIDNPAMPSYWAKLTPVELRHHLKELEESENKGLSVDLLRMPDSVDVCEAEVFEFDQHRQLQKAPSIDIKHVARGGRFRVIGFGERGLPPIVALTKGFHYLYSCDENDNVLNVIGDTQYAFEMTKDIDDRVSIGGREFLTPVKLVLAKGTSQIKVGDFITIDIITGEGAGRKLFFSADQIKGVRQRALALQVLLEMDKATALSFPGIHASVSSEEIHVPEEKKAAIQGELGSILKVVSLLDRLHITSELDVGALSNKDLAELNALYEAIVEDKSVNPGRQDEDVVVTNVKVGDLTILLWLTKAEDGFKVHDFFSPFDHEIAVAHEGTDERYPVSRFSILKADDYLRFSNIDWELIPADYKNLNLFIPEVAQYANMDVLNLLSAYDKSNRQEILDAALRLSNWLSEAGKDTNESVIFRINNLQAIKRVRSLTDAEMQEIVGYSDDKDASLEMKYCCDLLLDDQNRAAIHFASMSKDLQDYYRTLPISRFSKR